MRIRIAVALASAALLAGLLASPGVAGKKGDKGPRTYEVRIVNLTHGQPLTPPVVALHKNAFKLFKVGKSANLAIQEIAENGNSAPTLSKLGGSKHVKASLETTTGPLVPRNAPGAGMFDDEVTFMITAGKKYDRLSWASMLICTNDGFTGLGGVKVPKKVGGERSFLTFGYDAGTETNTEDLADIVPPCQGLIGVADGGGAPGTGTTNPALAEGGMIHHHGGIVGGVDLTDAAHGWEPNAPVALVEVERVS